VPPNSVVVGDISLIWGLYDHGLKIIQPHTFRFKRNYKFLEMLDYLVIYPKESLLSGDWKTIAEYYDYRLDKVAEYTAKRAYGYSFEIYKVLK